MIKEPVTIIGVGGIGSWTAALVVRLGCPILTLYDPDVVEAHNLENQNYDTIDIGRPKVFATQFKLYGIVNWHEVRGNPMKIIARQEEVNENTKLRGIVIVAVDSGEARKKIFEACRLNGAIPLYIEAGAAHDQGTVRAFLPSDPDHVHIYEQILKTFFAAEGPAACVSPYMGGQFASTITYWLQAFSEDKLPLEFMETEIDYTESPVMDTQPTLRS